MRILHSRLIGMAASVACVWALAACGRDTPVAPPDSSRALASVQVIMSATMEPLEGYTAYLDLRDTLHRLLSADGRVAVWSSSDSSIASVSGGVVIGQRPGDVTITARVDGVSGSANLHVAWRADARLVISRPTMAVQAGDRVVFGPTARRQIPAADVAWTVSNPAIARMDAPGVFTTLFPGTVTVVGRFLGLVDSVTINIVPGPVGFGYFYSGNAVAEDYDETFWTPQPGKSFSSTGAVSANWEVPYAGHPDLEWIGPKTPASDALLHVVSLENARCTAYLQGLAGFLFVVPDAPLVDCTGASVTQKSVRLEFVAFRSAEFTGTLALVRPGQSPSSTTAGGISEASATGDSRSFTMPGVARDSLFWFVTPGAQFVSACAIAADVAPGEVLRVACSAAAGRAADPVFYAAAFGRDTRHGSSPIGFVEVDGTGAVTRKAVNNLDIATTGSSVQSIDVTVSGARLAEFDRIPAVLVTAIAPAATACSITEPVRATSASVSFHVTCPAAASGVTLGVVY